jgi:hypothetical protein
MAARYSAFLGRRVEVLYRAGDLHLPATGTLVADSGRSIFLEERFLQKGRVSNFRWEIPYSCVMRVHLLAEEQSGRASGTFSEASEVEGEDFSRIPLRPRPTQT